MTDWASVTNLGDAALMLPLALVCGLWIRAADKSEAVRWVLAISIGMALVGLVKFLHAGCGTEISVLHFRVISGHTMLSSAIWTVTIALLLGSANTRWWRFGASLGLLLAAAIGLGRVFEHAHTPIEVVVGWFLGGTIALVFLRHFFKLPRTLPHPRIAGIGLLAVSSIAYGHHAPIQSLIVHYSPWLCRWIEF